MDITGQFEFKSALLMRPSLCDEKCLEIYPSSTYFGLYNTMDPESGQTITICKCGSNSPFIDTSSTDSFVQLSMECNYPCIGDDTAQCGSITHDSMAVYKRYKQPGDTSRRRLVSNSKDYGYYIRQMSRANTEKSQFKQMSDIKLKSIQPPDTTVIKVIYKLLPANEHSSIKGSIFKSVEANSDQFLQQTIDSFVVCTNALYVLHRKTTPTYTHFIFVTGASKGKWSNIDQDSEKYIQFKKDTKYMLNVVSFIDNYIKYEISDYRDCILQKLKQFYVTYEILDVWNSFASDTIITPAPVQPVNNQGSHVVAYGLFGKFNEMVHFTTKRHVIERSIAHTLTQLVPEISPSPPTLPVIDRVSLPTMYHSPLHNQTSVQCLN